MTVEITPSWLTEVLRASGSLPCGDVVTVTVAPTGAFNSETARVWVTLTDDAPPDAPTRYVVKQNTTAEWATRAGLEEIRFYRMVSTLPDHPPSIVPCLASGLEPDTGRSYLVLPDLTDTHRPPVTRDEQLGCAMPDGRSVGLVIDTLADLHAYWWERPADGLPLGHWTADEDRLSAYLERRWSSWRAVRAGNSWLPQEVAGFYERLLPAIPG